jgi:hypothetical protein
MNSNVGVGSDCVHHAAGRWYSTRRGACRACALTAREPPACPAQGPAHAARAHGACRRRAPDHPGRAAAVRRLRRARWCVPERHRAAARRSVRDFCARALLRPVRLWPGWSAGMKQPAASCARPSTCGRAHQLGWMLTAPLHVPRVASRAAPHAHARAGRRAQGDGAPSRSRGFAIKRSSTAGRWQSLDGLRAARAGARRRRCGRAARRRCRAATTRRRCCLAAPAVAHAARWSAARATCGAATQAT